MKKVIPLEKDIQKQILDYLVLRGIFCWKEHSAGIPIDGGKRFMPIGLKGKADILGVMPDGKFLAIEVKRENGKLSEFQVDFLYNIKRNGGISIVARSVEDVIDGLKNYDR